MQTCLEMCDLEGVCTPAERWNVYVTSLCSKGAETEQAVKNPPRVLTDHSPKCCPGLSLPRSCPGHDMSDTSYFQVPKAQLCRDSPPLLRWTSTVGRYMLFSQPLLPHKNHPLVPSHHCLKTHLSKPSSTLHIYAFTNTQLLVGTPVYLCELKSLIASTSVCMWFF